MAPTKHFNTEETPYAAAEVLERANEQLKKELEWHIAQQAKGSETEKYYMNLHIIYYALFISLMVIVFWYYNMLLELEDERHGI